MTDHALVESPLQFITAVEALADSPDAVIHWRANARGMSGFMDAYRPEWLPAGVRTRPGLPEKDLPAGGRLLLGDVCSGRIQKLLADGYVTRLLPQVVVLDDGLATVTVMRQLMLSSQPIQRPRSPVSALRLPLSAFVSSRLRGLARKGRLTWCTSLLTDPGLREQLETAGLRVQTHRFEHTRALRAAEAPTTPAVVIGSAMAADGLIDPDAYRGWVNSAAQAGPVTYYPHRREDPQFLQELRQDPRIRVEESGLPLELRLSALAPGTRIHSLPSTAALSLALMHPEAHVAITGVPAACWLPAAPQAFRADAQAVADDLDRMGLASTC